MCVRFARQFFQRFVLDLSRRDVKYVLGRSNEGFLEIISNHSIHNPTRDLHVSNAFYQRKIISCMSNLIISYEEILEAQNDDNILIIDIREHCEIRQTGKLPGSIHIPMDNVIYILQNLSKEAFKKQYGRNKPNKNSKIIFSCLAGKRSAEMQQKMQKLGYRNVYNYSGGWLDWKKMNI